MTHFNVLTEIHTLRPYTPLTLLVEARLDGRDVSWLERIPMGELRICMRLEINADISYNPG